MADLDILVALEARMTPAPWFGASTPSRHLDELIAAVDSFGSLR